MINSENLIDNLKGYIDLKSKIDEKGLSYEEAIEILDNVVLEKTKEEFVTVTDGWRGSLKLKECWVRDNEKIDWEKFEHVELLYREDSREYSFGMFKENIIHANMYKHLKFRPFSPENPPPVDWLCEVDGHNKEHFIEYDKKIIRTATQTLDTYIVNYHGVNETLIEYVKFLNIEPVED